MLRNTFILVAAGFYAFGQPEEDLPVDKLAPDLVAPSTTARAKSMQDEIDVIIQFHPSADRRLLAKRLSAVWGERGPANSELPLELARVKRADLSRLAADPSIVYISPDRLVGATSTLLPEVREVIGYPMVGGPQMPVETGKLVGIAIIDSGVNADDFLKDAATNCATSRIVYSQNFVAGESTTADLYGHGSHVAGIAAGNALCLVGKYAPYSGIARDARIINLRALNAKGQGTDSAVIAAIDRAIALRNTHNIKIINLSLGRVIKESFTLDPLCLAVEKAWKAGITVLVAAGNNGRDNSMNTQGYSTITSPGNDPYVITVGATRNTGHTGREDDTITSFSSKGPTLRNRIAKPDLVAPGSWVLSRMQPTTHLVGNYRMNAVGLGYGMEPWQITDMFMLSGTSMATPVAAGAVALLLQKDSTLRNDQIKSRLMKTAWKGFVPTARIADSRTNTIYDVQHDMFTVGAGMLDLKAALASTEKSASTRRALSPRVVRTNGQLQLTTSYSGVPGFTDTSSIVWGESIVWGTNVVWGSSVLAGTSPLMGSNVVWGSTTLSGNSIVWGESIIWGEATPFAEALSIFGDPQW